MRRYSGEIQVFASVSIDLKYDPINADSIEEAKKEAKQQLIDSLYCGEFDIDDYDLSDIHEITSEEEESDNDDE